VTGVRAGRTAGPDAGIGGPALWVPRVLSNQPHVLTGLLICIYLIMLPPADVKVSSNAELIGGNYTNVTSEAREVTPGHSPYRQPHVTAAIRKIKFIIIQNS
jgi:hypothetical protein